MRRRGNPTWAGPHLPSGGTAHESGRVADPANGARVPRCQTCGLPDLPQSQLMVFELWRFRKRAGYYRLCERCFNAANPPPVADPLDVTAA